MVFPASSLRHKGVIVDPQLKHAMAKGSFSGDVVAVGDRVFSGVCEPFTSASFSSLFASRLRTTRLLYAGHPLHATAPPVPLHLPSPLHDPSSALTIGIVFGGLFKFTGRWLLLDRRYNPHALHINVPSGALLQSGVFVVPQLEHCWPFSAVSSPTSATCAIILLSSAPCSSLPSLARRFLLLLSSCIVLISVKLVVLFGDEELVISYIFDIGSSRDTEY